MEFQRRKRGVPCPICGHQAWCTVSDNGELARCMRVEGAKESIGSDGSIGWIHRLREKFVAVERNEKKPPLNSAQVTEIARKSFDHMKAQAVRESVAKQLGVSVASLVALRVGYGCDKDGREWSSWPSRDAGGNVIGITRRYGNGEKKTMYRTRTGLFYPATRDGLRGPILIVEGGSDVAAAYSVGLPAIGRPSNTGGVEWIRLLLGKRKAIVIGENDCKPENRGTLKSCPTDCRGCGHCFPGLFGAQVVAGKLNLPYVIPPGDMKDLREVVSHGNWWALLREC